MSCLFNHRSMTNKPTALNSLHSRNILILIEIIKQTAIINAS